MSNLLFVQDIMHQYNDEPVFSNIHFGMKDGEWVGLLGGSGCGKSTLLRCIAGLIQPTKGTISIESKDITKTAPNKRGVGLVFQDYALFPTCTVRENINFGRVPSAPTCSELLSLVSLSGVENRLPSQLSGGQQQRVALARALAAQPKLLLLDEPFANIDAYKKSSLIEELRVLLRDVAVLFVTHDRSDAMSIADRIAVFDGGTITQIDTPLTVYTKPTTIGVAEKTGFCSTTTCSGEGEYRDSILGLVRVHSECGVGTTLLIRPEDFSCSIEENGEYRIEQTHYLGGRYQYWIQKENLRITLFGEAALPSGSQVTLTQKNPLWVIPESKA